MGEHNKQALPIKLAFHFVWTLIVARFIVGFTLYSGFSIQEWLNPTTWIYPLGFASILTITYWWYAQRD